MKKIKYLLMIIAAILFLFLLTVQKKYEVKDVCGYGNRSFLQLWYGSSIFAWDRILDIEIAWGLLGDDVNCGYRPEKNYLHISAMLNIGKLQIQSDPIATWGPPVK